VENPPIGAGPLDLSTYVSMGDSYSAGYMDNALFREGQQSSFAVLLADRFREVGGGEFSQPLVNPGVGLGTPVVVGGNNPRYTMQRFRDCTGAVVLEPAPQGGLVGDTAILSQRIPSLYHDLAIPLARSTDLTDPKLAQLFNIFTGGYNPYFERIALTENTSPAEMAARKKPTFFTLWAGNGDYLLNAARGGETDGEGVLGGGTIIIPNVYRLTPVSEFEPAYRTLIDSLTSNGAKGVLATLPNLLDLPHFTTIPYDTLVLDAAGVANLSDRYAGTPGISFRVGRNPLVVRDRAGQLRQMKPTEKPVLLAMPEIKCNRLGGEEPLGPGWFLEESEIQQIEARVSAYNAVIRDLAQEKGLALADINSFLSRVKAGTAADGIPMNASFITGGFYSLDGIHPSPRGHAMIANEFIRAINQHYGSRIPPVSVAARPGLSFP
jgi:hypothetical protein